MREEKSFSLRDVLGSLESNIQYSIKNDIYFSSLGLVGYYNTSGKQLTFVESRKYLGNLTDETIGVITNEETAECISGEKLACVTDNPRVLFFMLHNHLCAREEYAGRKKPTVIGKNCKISNMAQIAENNVVIGDNVTIEEFVSIKENVCIESGSQIHAGTVIGDGGFEYIKYNGTLLPVEHVGGVRIGKNVRIHNNVSIDKALYPWDDTIIEDDSKIDNNVYIAHGVKLGKACLVIGSSGILGRVEIGNGCKIGQGASIRNGVKIGDGADVSMGAVVTKDVLSGQKVTGNFAVEHSIFMEDFLSRIRK